MLIVAGGGNNDKPNDGTTDDAKLALLFARNMGATVAILNQVQFVDANNDFRIRNRIISLRPRFYDSLINFRYQTVIVPSQKTL